MRPKRSEVGPLFIKPATRRGFKREPSGQLELDRAVCAVQQGLIDYAYTSENLRRFNRILNGAAFQTAAYFPGAADTPADPDAVYEVRVDASQPACWGVSVMYAQDPARRPTGCYLAPGSIARVTVPRAMVGKGYGIRQPADCSNLHDLRLRPADVLADC